MALEWLSVLLGLVCTGGRLPDRGAGRPAAGRSRARGTVFPLGLLVVSVVAGVWEFATSGLEMSMVFLWLGPSLPACWCGWRRGGAGPCRRPWSWGSGCSSVPSWPWARWCSWPPCSWWWPPRAGRVAGGGSGRYLVPVAGRRWPCRSPSRSSGWPTTPWWCPTPAWPRRAGRPGGPRASPTCGTSCPPTRCGCRWCWPCRSWRSGAGRGGARGDRVGSLVLMTPRGRRAGRRPLRGARGRRLHARPAAAPRVLRPVPPVFVSLRQARGLLVVPLAGIVVWSVVCAGWLRFVPPRSPASNPQTVFISNERNSWITATGNAHPVTAADYGHRPVGPGRAPCSGTWPTRCRRAARSCW